MAWSTIDKAPTYGVVNPNNGSFFYNINENKWYNPDGSENINGVNFLNSIVYGDSTGNPLYIEELQKIKYENIVEANEFKSRNSCTAWVNFDGSTTPPTIRDSYNVSSVVRTNTGEYDVYFENQMDNSNYIVNVNAKVEDTGTASTYSGLLASGATAGNAPKKKTINSFIVSVRYNADLRYNDPDVSIQIFGGKQ